MAKKKNLSTLLLKVSLLLTSFTIAFAQEKPLLIIDPQGHSSVVRDILFSTNLETLISVSEDKTIRFWDVKSGLLKNTLRGYIGSGAIGKLNTAAISAGSKMLAVGGYLAENEIRIINLLTRKQIATLKGHSNVIIDLDFSIDNQYLASASGDGTIKIWHLPTLSNDEFTSSKPSLVLTLEGHTKAVYGVSFSPDGKRLVSTSLDGSIKIWELSKDIKSAREINSLEDHNSQVLSIDYSHDGKYFATGDYDGNVIVWKENGMQDVIIPNIGSPIFSLAFSSDGKNLAVITKNGGGIYEAPMWFKSLDFVKHNNTVTASNFAPEFKGKTFPLLASTGGNDNEILVWNSETGKVYHEIKGLGNAVWNVSFGKNLLAGINQVSKFEESNDKRRLTKTFDFNSLSFNPEIPTDSLFNTNSDNYNGKNLKRGDDPYTLKIGSKNEIINDKGKDRIIRSYAFTKDGKIVVGSGGSLKLYTNNGELIHSFIGHSGEVWGISVSEDSKYLLSGAGDQTVKLWNLETGENIVSLFVASDNEWVCWTPQGFYEASAGGEKYIGWQVNNGLEKMASFYPAHVFRKQFHKPDVVKKAIEVASCIEAIKLLNPTLPEPEVINPEPNILNHLPPKINWIVPEKLSFNTREKKVFVRARVTSDSPIKMVKLLVNGRNLMGKRGFKVTKKDTEFSQMLEYEVDLTENESIVQIFAENEHASITSEERTIHFIHDQNNSSFENPLKVVEYTNTFIEIPNLYVLSIGISDYADKRYNLSYADDDALAISAFYQKQEGNLYNNVYVESLIDEEATRSNILKKFKWIENKVQQKDVVVVFIASHGFNEDKNFYILPHDGNADQLPSTAVNWKNFTEVLGNLPSRTLLFLDACHSGQLGVNLSQETNNTEALRNLSSEQYGVVIMSGSTGSESSFEHPEWQHGAFTYALLQGMEKGLADMIPDRIVHLRELDLFVADQVHKLTKGKQHPTTQKPSTINTFPLVKLN